MLPKNKTAYYRRCYLTDGQGNDASGGVTLQDLMKEAAAGVPRPWLRRLGPGGLTQDLLTELIQKNGCICGEIGSYEPGRKIPLLDIQEDGSTWRDTAQPLDSAGVERKYQEHSFYFAIRENHVAVIQSVSFQVTFFRAFLTWFIQTRGNLIPDALIDLRNLPSKAALQKLKDHKIKGFSFSERLFSKVELPLAEEDEAVTERRGRRKRVVHRIETSSRVMELLKLLGVSQPILENIAKESDPGAIEVDVDINYRSRSEKEAIKVLHALASTLGQQEGLDTTIRLEGNGKIQGNELTICGILPVQAPDGCVSVDDALSKLSHWLNEQIKSKKVL